MYIDALAAQMILEDLGYYTFNPSNVRIYVDDYDEGPNVDKITINEDGNIDYNDIKHLIKAMA